MEKRQLLMLGRLERPTWSIWQTMARILSRIMAWQIGMRRIGIQRIGIQLLLPVILLYSPSISFAQSPTQALQGKMAQFATGLDQILQDVIIRQTFSYEGISFDHNAVDYKELTSSKEVARILNAESKRLSTLPQVPSGAQSLAFWINAYNFYTLKAIQTHYPIDSMKELGWKKRDIHIAGQTFSLDDIEHEHIASIGDARSHFAINCASVSCPSLRHEAYRAANLDKTLDEQTKFALRSPMHVRVTKAGLFVKQEKLGVSKIFKWFPEHFTQGNDSVEKFIRRYTSSENASNLNLGLAYLDYDWKLSTKANIQAYWQEIQSKYDVQGREVAVKQ